MIKKLFKSSFKLKLIEKIMLLICNKTIIL